MVNKNSSISEQKFLHTTNPLLSDASKSLTDLIDSLTKEQIVTQDLLLSLKGALYLIQQYSEMVPQRHMLDNEVVDVTNECFTVLSDSSTPIVHEEDQQVINFLDLNPHLVQPVSY